MKLKSFFNYTILFCFCVLSCASFAQDAYQRLYTTEDRTLINMGSIATSDGGFYMLNLAIDTAEPNMVNLIQVSRNNPKGNLLWTKEYTLRAKTLVTNLKSIDINQTSSDTLLINGITQILGSGGLEDERFIFKADPGTGEILWSGIESDSVDQLLPITLPVVLDGYDNSFVTYNTHGNAAGDTLGLTRIKYNSNNEVVSNITYVAQLENQPLSFAALLDASNTVDSNCVISFLADANQNISSYMLLDKDGEIKTSFNYNISPDSLAFYQMQATTIATTQDTSLLMSGFVVNLLTNGVSNFVIKSDTIGNILWSKFIDASDQGFISQVNDVIEKPDGTIAVSGKYQNVATTLVGDFIIYFDQNGNVIRQVDYGSDNSFFFIITTQGAILFGQGEMSATVDGGLLYSTSGIDAATGNISPYIIKADPLGDAFCSDTLDFDLVRDFAFIRDTLIMDQADYVVTDTVVITEEDYDNFNIPVLLLVDTVYCPQDPIMQTIDATLEGATMYEWSTGETTPSIFVTEEGMYTVTVTVGEKVCYALCDTSTIAKTDFPEATITPDFSGLCELGEVNLNANSTTGIVSAIWESGETTNFITVTQAGTYTVTITDQCSNTAEATINLSDDLFDLSISSTIIPGLISCSEGNLIQALEVVSQSNANVESILWSTGETTETIQGTENVMYSVTVTNECGNSSTAEFLIEEQEFDPNLNIDFGEPRIVCNGDTKSVILVAVINSASNDYEVVWSTNEIGEQIAVNQPGTYSVTITNGCGDSASASTSVSEDIFEGTPPMPIITSEVDSLCNITLIVDPNIEDQVVGINPQILWSDGQTSDSIIGMANSIYMVTVTDGCGQTGTAEINAGIAVDSLMFPNLFFPNSPNNIDDNKMFGPYVPCSDLFTGINYKLEVFNRFGNRVFQTTNVETKWNGNFSGSNAPRDVYMYQYSYENIDGTEVTGSGSITLYR